jgi:hypothetical protein
VTVAVVVAASAGHEPGTCIYGAAGREKMDAGDCSPGPIAAEAAAAAPCPWRKAREEEAETGGAGGYPV